jgi:hypothetical protein
MLQYGSLDESPHDLVNAPFGDVLRDLLRDPIGHEHQPERFGQTRLQIDAVIDRSLFAMRAENGLAGEIALRRQRVHGGLGADGRFVEDGRYMQRLRGLVVVYLQIAVDAHPVHIQLQRVVHDAKLVRPVGLDQLDVGQITQDAAKVAVKRAGRGDIGWKEKRLAAGSINQDHG